LIVLPRPLQDLFQHEILHKGAGHLGSRCGRAEIKGILTPPYQLIVYAVAHFVGNGEDIVKPVCMVKQDVSRLSNGVMSAEGASGLPLPGIYIYLSL
jgi:hypothetical protein